MNPINKLSYKHERIIDAMLVHPDLTQGELACMLGYTEAWFSTVTNSDMFRAEYGKRRAAMNERMADVAIQRVFTLQEKSAERLLEYLDEEDSSPQIALDVQKLALQTAGMLPERES